MKLLLSTIITGLLLISFIGCKTPDYIMPPVTGNVTTENTPVWDRINGDKKIAELKIGTSIKIISRSGGKWPAEPNGTENRIWFKIQLSDGKLGWVYSGYIKPILKEQNSLKEITFAYHYQIKLNEAISAGDMNAVKNLINQGADGGGENYKDYPSLRSPISHAAFLTRTEMVHFFMKFNPPQYNKDRAIISSASGTDLKLVEYLLKNGANINAREKQFNRTPLILCSGTRFRQHPYFEIMQFLVKNGADVNAVDSFGNSALMYAVTEKQVKAVKFLVDNGAKVNIRNGQGESPLLLASEISNNEIKNILVQAGATDMGQRRRDNRQFN